MANQYFNLYYDPLRQGYDTSSWRTLFGDAPVVGASRLMIFPQSAILHYGDILRGDAVFNVNLPAPAVGDDKTFGYIHYNKNAYAYFNIINDVFTAETSDGSNSDSVTIVWQSAWTNTNTEFRIKWEAGTATFFVGGVQQAVIQDVSVSGGPLSLYLANNSDATLLLNYIEVKAIQSYILHESLDDSAFEPIVYESDQVNIAESVTVSVADDLTANLSDSLTVSDVISMTPELDGNISVVDSIDVTESVTVIPPTDIDLSDSIDLTESVTAVMS